MGKRAWVNGRYIELPARSNLCVARFERDLWELAGKLNLEGADELGRVFTHFGEAVEALNEIERLASEAAGESK